MKKQMAWKRAMKKGIAGILTAVLTVGLIPIYSYQTEVQAEETTDVLLTPGTVNLNIDGKIAGITDPAEHNDPSQEWQGSKVYFGSDSYKGADTISPLLFLDCETILEERAFSTSDDTVLWKDSEVRTWLNETVFGGFSAAEQNAVAESTRSSGDNLGSSRPDVMKWTGLSSDRLFFLDGNEITHIPYDFCDIAPNTAAARATTVKKDSEGTAGRYWLRSQSSRDDVPNRVGSISDTGSLTFYSRSMS